MADDMKSRKEGYTQQISSAKAGISERSGRDIEKNKRRLSNNNQRKWRTRSDPFNEVWSSELEPMLIKEPSLSGLTLLEYLQDKYGATKYPDNKLRTLQRRVKHWSHTKGPSKEVVFRQEHSPGQLGLSDFTTLKDVTVTIMGQPLKHLLYHFRLQYSKWSYMDVILGGESYTALTQGLQNALWSLGGSPLEHRTDSLSAAYKNVHPDVKSDQSKAYQDFCQHYNMEPSRNNKGVAHENGGIESPHGHLKRRILQAFLLRGSYDFDSVDSYRQWLSTVVNNHNRRNAKQVHIEKMALQALPSYKTADYTLLPVKVSISSTIQVRTSLYTVPSRLKGCNLQVHLYDDHLECFFGGEKVADLVRVYGKAPLRRARNVDYRHVIDSLAKKPMAFYKSQLRDSLLPNPAYHRIWCYLMEQYPARDSSRLMVGLLDLAAKTGAEDELAIHCLELIEQKIEIDLLKLRKRFNYPLETVDKTIRVAQHDLSLYDQLIPCKKESSHAVH